jgi:hypothetical protein
MKNIRLKLTLLSSAFVPSATYPPARRAVTAGKNLPSFGNDFLLCSGVDLNGDPDP